MSDLAEINRILRLFREKIQGAKFWKAYNFPDFDISVKETNVTVEFVRDIAENDGLLGEIRLRIYLPEAFGMLRAEQIFLEVYSLLEETGEHVSSVRRSAVLRDRDLGLMMVPCTVVLQADEGKEPSSGVMVWINGVRTEAGSVHISVKKTQKELTSFGEEIPFDIYRGKTVYQLTFKQFDGREFEGLDRFTCIPEDGTGFVYANCSWSKYSLTGQEYTLVSAERRTRDDGE